MQSVTNSQTQKTENARRLIVERARTFSRPLLVGHVAVECHMSLKEAESLLDALVDEGVLRRATPKELRDYDLHGGYRPANSPAV